MNISKVLVVFLILVVSSKINAEVFDGSTPLLCATTEIFECTFEDGCVKVQPEEINAPQFLKIDYEKKTIKTIPERNPDHASEIEHHEKIDGKLILQGIEESIEGVREGLGWTISIMENTGKMSLTASGNEVGFIILGACTEL